MSDRSTDVASVKAIIADHERAFNTKDAELLAAHFRERSWAVGVNGVELAGPVALVEAAKAAFAGPLADGRARYRPGDVEFLGDDVAICHMYATLAMIEATTLGHVIGNADALRTALHAFRQGDGVGWAP